MAKEPVVIRRTSTVEEAEVIVVWLDSQGIEATIIDRDNPGVLAFGLTDVEGIAICVADSETAQRAQTLLAEHDKQHAASSDDAVAQGSVEVRCGECGQLNSFPVGARDTVQECAQCGAYLDLPETEG